ncbi:MAG TPA: cytochrome c3 family protein, partial [Anaerolineales bacterium]
SSCKNCHETQGQKPVNNDGKPWHTAHAFGDFCYACHGGNNQSMDKATAHTGMVDPLLDPKTACQSCHPNDLDARVKVYTDILGVPAAAGAGTTPAAGGTPQATQPSAAAATPTPAAPAAGSTGGTGTGGTTLQVGSANLVDYNQQYDTTVLGRPLINWGNVIVALLVLFVLAGGGAYVYWNERKLRGLPFGSTAAKKSSAAAAVPVVEGYSPEVAALLPQIAQLTPVGLHALRRLLENPEQANELLHSLSRLDPDLIRRIRALDDGSRAMLLALSGD